VNVAEEIAEVYDVIIVGGGFTGLTAARELARRGVKFRLLDAFPDHLGGRAFSYDPGVTAGSKLRFDHGAEYVGETQNDIMQIIREHLGPDALVNGAHLRAPYPHQVILIDGTRHVFKLEDSLFGIKGVPPKVGIGAAIAFLGLLAEMMLIEIQIDTLEPWKGDDDLLELDKISITQWLDGKKWVSPSVRDLLTLSVEALLSVEPSEISIYFLLWYSACNNGFLTAINDDTAGPQQYWLKEGVGTLAERYADAVRDRIQQGVFVDEVDLSGEHVAVTTRGGAKLHAKKVLLAMSPHTAGRIAYVPEPPAGRRALMSLPMGRTLKCQVFYKSSWWHDVEGIDFNGYGGGCNHSVLWTMDNSPPPESGDDTHVLMTFTVGAQLDALGGNLSQDAIEAWVTGGIRDFFGDDRALSTSSEFVKLVHYLWSDADPYVGGGPNIVYPPGALTGEVGRHMNEHWDDRVFFASAENAKNLEPTSRSTHWNVLHDDNMPKYTDDGLLLADPPPPYRTNYSDVRQSLGYLDGAIVSGRYVASEIAASLGLKDEPASRRSTLSAPSPSRRGPVSRPTAAAALGVFESIRAEVDAATHEDIKAWKEHPAGPKGYASWVHKSLVEALGAASGDPVKRLEMVRDFAETVAPRLHGDDGAPDSAPVSEEELPVFERIRVLVADTDAAIRKKLGLD
jgi:monoamine oxidase